VISRDGINGVGKKPFKHHAKLAQQKYYNDYK